MLRPIASLTNNLILVKGLSLQASLEVPQLQLEQWWLKNRCEFDNLQLE